MYKTAKKLTKLICLVLCMELTMTCITNFSHNDVVCDYNGFSSYETPSLFCQTGLSLLKIPDYCKRAKCLLCQQDKLLNCKLTLPEQNTLKRAVYVSQSDLGSDLPSPAFCVIESGEICYRTAEEDSYWEGYTLTDEEAEINDPECCMYECKDKFNFNRDQGCGSDGVFYNSISSFCVEFCKNRTLILNECFTGNCGSQQGCSSPCTDNLPNNSFCSKDFVLFNSKDQLCIQNDHSIVDYFDCDGGCSQSNCEEFKCIEANLGYPLSTVCLNSQIIDQFFFESISEFCAFLISNSIEEGLYEVEGLEGCGVSGCSDKEGCCYKRCMEQTYHERCNSNDFTLITKEIYCEDTCKETPLITFETCFNQNDPLTEISCSDCNIFKCQNDLLSSYNEIGVCGVDDFFYESTKTFCEKYPLTFLDNIRDCSDSSVCQNERECCESNCLANTQLPYSPKCNNIDYIYRETLKDYCSSFCENNKTFITYQNDNGNNASKEECLLKKCHERDLIDFNQNSKVCSNTNTLYKDKEEFCSAQQLNFSLKIVFCPNGCQSEKDCCQQNCVETNEEYQPICDSHFNLFQTPTSFCLATCSDPNLDILDCDGSNCSEWECCYQQCVAQNFNDVCRKDTPFLFPIESFCTSICNGEIEEGDQMTCANDCESSDCLFNCMFANSSETHCTNDSTFYNTAANYCMAVLGNPTLEEVKCEGDSFCQTEKDCCKANCIQNNENYVVTCNSNFDIFGTVEEFCEYQCTEGALGNAQCDGVDCSEWECCLNKCNDGLYTPSCSSSYELLTQNGYCVDFCEDNSFDGFSCEGDCTEKKCEVLECQHSLSHITHSVCLEDPFNEKIFFKNILSYCEEKYNIGDEDYSSFVNIDCNGQGCFSEEECCEQKCLNSNYLSICVIGEDNPLSHSDFCTYRCNNPDGPVISCYEENNPTNQIPCSVCSSKSCIDQLEENQITHNTICLQEEYSDKLFFNSKSDYCDEKALNYDNDFSLLMEDLLGCNETECSDNFNCCIAHCQANTPDLVACNEHNTLVSRDTICQNKCNNDSFAQLVYCGTTDCTTCEFRECFIQNSHYTLSTVCSRFDLEFEEEIFFNSLATYCEAVYKGEYVNYSLTGIHTQCSIINNDNTCPTSTNCCEQRCKNSPHNTGCHPEDFRYLDQNEFCEIFCQNKDFTQLSCLDQNNGIINCNEQLCCDKHTVEMNAPIPFCANDSNVYESYESFCEEKLQNDSLLVKLYINPVFNICGSDFLSYTSLIDYCTALNTIQTLEQLGDCSGEECDDNYCCSLKCDPNDFSPVVIEIKEGELKMFDNQCYANCFLGEGVVSDVNHTCPNDIGEGCVYNYCVDFDYCGINGPPVCGENGKIYKNECLSKCDGNKESEICEKDCKSGEFNLVRCEFYCEMKFFDLET